MSEKIKTHSEIEEELFPSNSLLDKYRDYMCVVPGFGVYIPFISTRDTLTSGGARAMITGTSDRYYYEN